MQSTGETTSHPTKQSKDDCQVVGYIQQAACGIDTIVPLQHIQSQPLPTLVPQLLQHLNIIINDLIRARESRHGAIHAFLAQQMQRGVRRTIGVILNVVRCSARKLILRMEAGNLEFVTELRLSCDDINRSEEHTSELQSLR